MRAQEFINEAKEGKLPKHAERAMPTTLQMRDVGGYDRTYHLNRIMMAAACADGSNNKIDVDRSSWTEKYNTAHPYTELEAKMMKQALKTIPSEHHSVISDHKSREMHDTHKASPVIGFKGFGKESKKTETPVNKKKK
jgi:hypothetical protein